MFRVVESQRVSFAIHLERRARFRRELLAVPLNDCDGELALVRVRTLRKEPTRGALLLVHGFGMNRHTWHLNGRSFVGHLADEGFDVYVLELRGVGRSRDMGAPVARHVDEYIEHDLPAAIAAAVLRSGHEKVFVIGHSMGGLVTYCAMPELYTQLAGVITLSAIFTFAGGSRFLNALSTIGRLTPLPSSASESPFAVKKIGELLTRWVKVADSRAMLALLPFQAWYPRGIERELLLEQIRIGWDVSSIGVLLNLLRIGRSGQLRSLNGRAYLDEMPDVDIPLLVVAAENDTLLPPVDAHAAYAASHSSDKEFLVFGPDYGHQRYGHLDMILGRRAPAEIWPPITRWLAEHTQPAGSTDGQ